MKKIAKVLGVIGFLLILIFSHGIGKLAGMFTSQQFFKGKRDSELGAVLMQTASELNQNLPIMVDAETRLDTTTGSAISGNNKKTGGGRTIVTL